MPITVQDITVDLEQDHYRQYRRLEREFFTVLDSGQEVEVFNAAAKSNKCLQFANGAVYEDAAIRRSTDDFKHVHDAKLDALADLIESLEEQPLLVCYTYQMDAIRIKERFPQAVDIKDSKNASGIVDAWNRGEIPLLIGHPGSMGHGLNLQRGGHHIAWFGLNWNLELYDQAIGRLHRQGQTRPVVVHRLLTGGTLDLAVAEALSSKATTQSEFLKSINKYRGQQNVG